MTQQEQFKIIAAVIELTASGFSAGKKAKKWAQETYCQGESGMDVSSAGWSIQCRAKATDEWHELNCIAAQHAATESSDDRRRREVDAMGTFTEATGETSNQMGDITEVRCVPYVMLYDSKRKIYFPVYQEEEAILHTCTDTGTKPEWNKLTLMLDAKPSDASCDYTILRKDMQAGDDLNWLLYWHFFLDEDAACPVAPLTVEEIDNYHITLRYRDRLITLGAGLCQTSRAVLEEAVAVEPTNKWYKAFKPGNYVFNWKVRVEWRENPYARETKEEFQTMPPQQYSTSELPADVRTMQQRDHDAWEEATGRHFVPEGH